MTLKQSIDKLSEYCAKYLRNRYHYSIVAIQQQAFESEGNEAFKLGRVRPSVAGLGDSKYVSRDADIVLGLFSPFRFGITEYFGYDISILKDHIRFLEVIVNRNGEMGGLLPLWFDGAVCDFRELPLPEDKANIDAIYKHCKVLETAKHTAKQANTVPTLLLNINESIRYLPAFFLRTRLVPWKIKWTIPSITAGTSLSSQKPPDPRHSEAVSSFPMKL
jgi:hypothetical protein